MLLGKTAMNILCCQVWLKRLDDPKTRPWTARWTNKSIIEEISLEAQMMKLHLSYFDHRVRRERSLEKDIMIEKLEGTSCRGRPPMRRIDTITTTTGFHQTSTKHNPFFNTFYSIKSPRLKPKLMGHDHNIH